MKSMRNGITALAIFAVFEYLAILFKIDILEDINIFAMPRLMLPLLGYVGAFGLIEITTRRSTTKTKIVIAGVVALLAGATIFGASFTTKDGIVAGIWQFLAVLATIPFLIYMLVIYTSSRRRQGEKQGTPNQAL